jgi:hypothetical protein
MYDGDEPSADEEAEVMVGEGEEEVEEAGWWA